MSRAAQKKMVRRSLRISEDLNESIKLNRKTLGAESENELIIHALRFYFDHKSNEIGSRRNFNSTVEQKLAQLLDSRLRPSETKLEGISWYLSLILELIFWLAVTLIDLMRNQLTMSNQILFLLNKTEGEARVQEQARHDEIEKQIMRATAFDKRVILKSKLDYLPKIHQKLMSSLDSLHQRSQDPSTGNQEGSSG